MKIEDHLVNSNLSEAKKQGKNQNVTEAFGIGYFVDPSGKVQSLGKGVTHEEWAGKKDNTVKDLINRGWTRMRNFGSSSLNYVQGDSDKFDKTQLMVL